jgi:multicomponent Na+:H+ antiporter subunit E
VTTAGLVLVWCGLWGSVSIANLASGLALSVVVLAADRGPTARHVISFRPLLRFAWLVFVDLARSTINVAIEIATPNDGTEEVIVAVDLPATGSEHMLLLSASITLSPGTAVVDVDRSTGRYYIHLLHGRLSDETVAHAHKLAKLACEALPTSRPMGSPTGVR